MKSTQLRWGRVLVGGFLAELLVRHVFPALYLLGSAPFGRPFCRPAVMPFIFAVWVGRHRVPFRSPPLIGSCRCADLHRPGVGSARRQFYKVAHGLKVVGGVAGGVVASRRKPAVPVGRRRDSVARSSERHRLDPARTGIVPLPVLLTRDSPQWNRSPTHLSRGRRSTLVTAPPARRWSHSAAGTCPSSIRASSSSTRPSAPGPASSTSAIWARSRLPARTRSPPSSASRRTTRRSCRWGRRSTPGC
jgi:hypothetical protein